MADTNTVVRLPGPFSLWRGGELQDVEVAYESWGEPGARRDNTVLLFTGLSPSAHAAATPQDPTPGWWEFMIGPGKPIDTNRYHVVCVNSLGSCYGSTGPSSINPVTGAPYRMSFPELSVEDIAKAGREVVRALGIERLHTVMGASLGGMTALAYAIDYPDEVEHLVTLCSAAHATPHTIATRSLQRDIIRSDPAWQEGNYATGEGPKEGMRLARKLGLMSYRSAEEWDQRFGRERVKPEGERVEPFDIEFQVESYLDANARKFVGCFDANSYLYLSRAMDWFDVAEYGGSLEAGLSRIKARRTLVVGVDTDTLFPVEQQREMVEVMNALGRDAELVRLPSVQGHDAFLVDRERFGRVIGDFFASYGLVGDGLEQGDRAAVSG